jgi:hypothetical protein
MSSGVRQPVRMPVVPAESTIKISPVSSTGCLPLLQRQLRCRTTHVENLCPLGSSPAGFSTTHILLVFSPLQPFALIDACGCIVTFSCPRKLFIPLLMVHCIGLNLLWGVTNFRLIRAPLRYRMPLTHTNSLRLPHTAEPILTEPHCRPRH